MSWYFRGAAAPLLVIALLAGGCKEATVGPDNRGTIAGRVLDYETGEPIARASITTTPPSEAVLSGTDGRFELDQLPVGSYQVSARKSGYTPTTVAVSVQEDRTTSATIYLEEEDEETETDSVAVDVDVLNFWNTGSSDSTYVEAEYRIQNRGDVAVSEYEIYFQINTDSATYYHDEEGSSLGVGQTDVQRFRTFIPSGPVTSVEVDDLWTDPPLDS